MIAAPIKVKNNARIDGEGNELAKKKLKIDSLERKNVSGRLVKAAEKGGANKNIDIVKELK